MDIIKVRNKFEISEFHQITHRLYKNEKKWIPHIKQDVESVFNPKRNSYHKNGEIERFILRKDKVTIGRIAVFYNNKPNKESLRTGGVGFFECINNQEAANLLFDTSVSKGISQAQKRREQSRNRTNKPYLRSAVNAIMRKKEKMKIERDKFYSMGKQVALQDDETISEGMIPKIRTCINALENGVRGVVIIDGRKPHSILFELFSDQGSGTLIRK